VIFAVLELLLCRPYTWLYTGQFLQFILKIFENRAPELFLSYFWPDSLQDAITASETSYQQYNSQPSHGSTSSLIISVLTAVSR